MRTEYNLITNWLMDNNNPKINTFDLYKSMLGCDIKLYCKNFKIKFEQFTKQGFIGSYNSHIKAARVNEVTGEFKIRKVGTNRIFQEYITFVDGDIVMGDIVNRKILG